MPQALANRGVSDDTESPKALRCILRNSCRLGLAPARQSLAGQPPISFGALPPAVQYVKEGKLRALAITSTAPSPALAGVPTVAEAGYPEIAADIWTAVLVPAGTSKEIVALLQREIARVVGLPETRERMAALGYQPVGNTPDECTRHIATEAARWAKVIRDAGIKVDNHGSGGAFERC
jgi:tripartite-type tricarboxylate transporter receptor subunit TctC